MDNNILFYYCIYIVVVLVVVDRSNHLFFLLLAQFGYHSVVPHLANTALKPYPSCAIVFTYIQYGKEETGMWNKRLFICRYSVSARAADFRGSIVRAGLYY